MKLNSHDVRFLLLTAGLVALLGARAVADLLVTEPELVATVPVASRDPASLMPTVVKAAPIAVPGSLLEWKCRSGAGTPAHIQGSTFRLKGGLCEEPFVADRLTIVNETNGFTASIFLKGKAAFETDLIQLEDGLNLIRLVYKTSSGQRIESVLSITSSSI